MKLIISLLLVVTGFCNCRVYVDGVWDLLHEGHNQLYQQAINKAHELHPGQPVKLIVGICGASDQMAIYKRSTIMSLYERARAVSAHPLVDEIIYQAPVFGFNAAFLEDNAIDLVIHGDDFSEESKQKYYGAAIKEGKFATVPYTKGISTTQLIREAESGKPLSSELIATQLSKTELINRIQSRKKPAKD